MKSGISMNGLITLPIVAIQRLVIVTLLASVVVNCMTPVVVADDLVLLELDSSLGVLDYGVLDYGASDGVASYFQQELLTRATPWDRDGFNSLLTQIQSTEQHTDGVHVPEPLLFDLVRPLGVRKGEVEVNTLMVAPWMSRNTNLNDDPFGDGPTTPDLGGIEWAPEIEYGIADNFAIEFELPFESSTLEEYKLGLQWTIGPAFDNRYIHGVQMLVQPNADWEHWNTTLLYLGGIRFDETWSALFMLGARMDLEGPDNSETFERLTNVSIFADITDKAKLGVETNNASKSDGTSEFSLIPQVHYEVTENFQVQSGLGFSTFSEGAEQSFILRVIYAR
jgi:hypothetical protein